MNSIDKQVADTIRKKKVNQLSKSIRKKYLSLKLGKSENDETLNKLFKPVVEPLEKIIRNQSLALPSTASPTPSPPTKAERTDKVQEEVEDDEDLKVFNQIEEKLIKYVDQFPPITKTFMIENITDSRNDKIDKIYSPQFNHKTYSWKMGSKIIKFDRLGNILMDNKRFKGTPGLYQLLFYKEPVYVKEDLNAYKELLEETNVHRNTRGNLKSSKQFKYYEVIKPLAQRPRSSSTSGFGLPTNKMIFNRNPIEYRYWDDPNELCERLRLLIAAQGAGNTSVQNEIVAIINELKEANIIRELPQ